MSSPIAPANAITVTQRYKATSSLDDIVESFLYLNKLLFASKAWQELYVRHADTYQVLNQMHNVINNLELNPQSVIKLFHAD